jgi:STE24 endopeptidase
MPIPLLVALLIAFGMNLPGPVVSGPSLSVRLLEMAGGISLIAILAFGLGGWVASRVSHFGYASGRVFRRYQLGSRVLTLVGLAVYAWIVSPLGWSGLVLSGWGLQGLVLVDDLAILLPYIVIQLIIWSGLYFADRALHNPRNFPRLPLYLTLKSRQSIGLVLPVVLIFVVRQDVFSRLWPLWHQAPAAEVIELSALGFLVLACSPLFIRLAWPTRSLPDGPLRHRLERVARRAGFRFNDLLIWDTRHLMVNACVTGVLPWFRYVLLSDALVDALNPVEVAAVFGHELGHVEHRHLPFFGLFFLGSMGLLSVASHIFSVSSTWVTAFSWIPTNQIELASDLVEAGLLLGCLGIFFWIVFGRLSRRFERQADIFGCKVVSCDGSQCPPHFDFEEESSSPEWLNSPFSAVCPVGIQIFSSALISVAHQNGIDPQKGSWRHGSIANRLDFLRTLQVDPTREPVFQQQVRWFRLALSAFLLLMAAIALLAYSWDLLR